MRADPSEKIFKRVRKDISAFFNKVYNLFSSNTYVFSKPSTNSP